MDTPTTLEPTLAALLHQERERQERVLSMIPSENAASPAVLAAVGSVLMNKYAEGYPGKRYYGGNEVIDQIERLTQDRARTLFGAEHANVQPYSGSPANVAVYLALLKPGDTVLGMSLPHGGHLTHGWKVSVTGTYFNAVQYPVGDDGLLDYDHIRSVARKHKPKLIIAGATAYPRHIDFAAFAGIAEEVAAYFLADMSHIAGLVAGQVHPSPIPHAHVVTTTTHKTLRGPRGALILSRTNDPYPHTKKKVTLAQKLDRAVFPGLQGGPHEHTIAGIAEALHEASQPAFREYAQHVVENARTLAATLLEGGMPLATGGTDTHLMIADVSPFGLTGQEAETLLESIGVVVNKNLIPNDPRPPMNPSGIRIGTPLLTTRGMTLEQMRSIGTMIVDVLRTPKKNDVLDAARKTVQELTTAFPLYPPTS